jgi:hypothetical protein
MDWLMSLMRSDVVVVVDVFVDTDIDTYGKDNPNPDP